MTKVDNLRLCTTRNFTLSAPAYGGIATSYNEQLTAKDFVAGSRPLDKRVATPSRSGAGSLGGILFWKRAFASAAHVALF